MSKPTSRAAVVGAGLSGLTCGRDLALAGYEVVVFDKARGAGGRMSTRRTGARDRWSFDHGAQYFTARHPAFAAEVDAWVEAGVAAPWRGRIFALDAVGPRPVGETVQRYVGVPRMSAVTGWMCRPLRLELGSLIAEIEREEDGWIVIDDRGQRRGLYDRLALALPAPQAAPLLEPAPDLAARADSVRFAPSWAVMAFFDRRLDLPYDAAFVNTGPLSWIARDSSKPGRAEGERWVLHASAEWSSEHLELEPEEALGRLLEAFREALGESCQEPSLALAHRWRYALPTTPLEEACLHDSALGLGACGDWCGGPRVEGAFLSGRALGRLLSKGP